MDTQNNTLTIREYPLGEWGFGIVMFSMAGFTALGARGDWSISLIAGAAGVLFILFATILVVQADRVNGTLTIRRTSVLRRYVREIPISDIAALQIDAARSSSSTYRIVVITRDNEIIPFRTAYSSGAAAKEAKAKQLAVTKVTALPRLSKSSRPRSNKAPFSASSWASMKHASQPHMHWATSSWLLT